jgi:hypothetical protein
VTVRRPGAPRRSIDLERSLELQAALRSSREALARVEGELGALLAALRDPAAALDAAAPDRLSGAARRAGNALASLGALAQQR